MCRTQPFADWILDVSEELVDFAYVLYVVIEKVGDTYEEDVPKGGNLSKPNMHIPKRNMIPSFNVPTDMAHQFLAEPITKSRLPQRDGANSVSKRGEVAHTKAASVKFSSSACTVLLCLSIPANLRKHFWYIWHTVGNVAPRQLSKSNSSGTTSPFSTTGSAPIREMPALQNFPALRESKSCLCR